MSPSPIVLRVGDLFDTEHLWGCRVVKAPDANGDFQYAGPKGETIRGNVSEVTRLWELS